MHNSMARRHASFDECEHLVLLKCPERQTCSDYRIVGSGDHHDNATVGGTSIVATNVLVPRRPGQRARNHA